MTRTAVVVGVGDGLGTAMFRRFAERGMDTAICTARPEETESVVQDLHDTDRSALAIECDPRNPVAIAHGCVDVLDAFGSIDVVVFVAGAPTPSGLFELTRADFLDAIDRDLLGGFCTARAVVPKMRETGGGTLLFVGGPASLTGRRDDVGASTTQAGLRGLAGSIDAELGDEFSVSYVTVDVPIDASGGEETSGVDDLARRCTELVTDKRYRPLNRDYRLSVDDGTATVEPIETTYT